MCGSLEIMHVKRLAQVWLTAGIHNWVLPILKIITLIKTLMQHNNTKTIN